MSFWVVIVLLSCISIENNFVYHCDIINSEQHIISLSWINALLLFFNLLNNMLSRSESFSFLKLSEYLMRNVAILHLLILVVINRIFISRNSILIVDTVVIREIIDVDWFLKKFWMMNYEIFAENKLRHNCICDLIYEIILFAVWDHVEHEHALFMVLQCSKGFFQLFDIADDVKTPACTEDTDIDMICFF